MSSLPQSSLHSVADSEGERRAEHDPGALDAEDLRSVGAAVLRLEAEGLEAMAAGLDDRFDRAINLIFSLKGRVVTTGIGKSGHIATKIAATLASTGTPAMFVHPAEAGHGDLGMITPEDAILVLSNSGAMPELSVLVPYAKRFGIPVIGMTRDGASALAQIADLALVLPAMPEACPLHLAPTTSSTMMLALGDALAMALLKKRGFSSADFRTFHPGGALGKQLLRVGDLMHAGDALPLIAETAPMPEALVRMTEKSFGCVGIVDSEGYLAGIVTDGDLRRHMAPDLLMKPVVEIMTRHPKTITADALAAQALGIMNQRSITSLFVVREGRPEGILHIHDCLRAGVI